MAEKVNQSQTKGRINAKGNLVYDAPIEIRDHNDLRNYGITWKDCVHLRIGGIESVNVYMVETDNLALAV